MSNSALNAVWDRSQTKGGPLLVLLALADSANKETGLSWLGTSTLAKMSRLSERHISRILGQLVDDGEIEIEKIRPGTSTVYFLTPGGVPVVPIDKDDHIDKAGPETPDKMSGVEANDAENVGDSTPDKMSSPPPTKCPPTPDSHVTPPLTPMSGEPLSEPLEPKEEPSPPVVPPVQSENLIEAVRAYNVLAEKVGLARVQNFNDNRRRKLRRRLAECGGLEGWSAALAKVECSNFLTGGGREGWRADFDFMLQAKSFTKILEGAYDDNLRGGGKMSEVQAAFDRMDTIEKCKR